MNVNNDLENPLLTENGNKTLTGKRIKNKAKMIYKRN